MDIKLQSRSSQALGIDIEGKVSPDWVDISDNHEMLWHFLCGHNGVDLFDSALVFLPSIQSLSAWPTLEDVYHQFRELDFMQEENLLPFAVDLFGFFYMINADGIYHMETEDARLEYVAEDINSFLLKLVENGDYWSGQSFLQSWEKQKKPLLAGERLAAKTPFIFGGEFSVDNFYNQPLDKMILWYASLHEQLKNVEDGAVIQLQIPEEFS